MQQRSLVSVIKSLQVGCFEPKAGGVRGIHRYDLYTLRFTGIAIDVTMM